MIIKQTIEIRDTSNGNDGVVTVEIVAASGAVLAKAALRSEQVTVVESTPERSGRWEYRLPHVQDVAWTAINQLEHALEEAKTEMRRQGLLK